MEVEFTLIIRVRDITLWYEINLRVTVRQQILIAYAPVEFRFICCDHCSQWLRIVLPERKSIVFSTICRCCVHVT